MAIGLVNLTVHSVRQKSTGTTKKMANRNIRGDRSDTIFHRHVVVVVVVVTDVIVAVVVVVVVRYDGGGGGCGVGGDNIKTSYSFPK